MNGEDPGYRRFIVGEDGVIRRYMRLGAAGFRLDVADELSDGFIADIHSAVREEREDGAIIGEVWEDASNKIAYGARRSYLLGGELDSVMNYPMREAIIGYVMRGDAELFRSTAVGIYRRYPRVVSDSLMNLLGTHDTERILTVLGGISGDGKNEDELCKMRMTTEQRKKALSRLRCAFAILFTVYGVPSVFYGDEAGVEGYHDPFCRRPYPWGRGCRAARLCYTARRAAPQIPGICARLVSHLLCVARAACFLTRRGQRYALYRKFREPIYAIPSLDRSPASAPLQSRRNQRTAVPIGLNRIRRIFLLQASVVTGI